MPALTHTHNVGVAESGCHRPAAHRHSDRYTIWTEQRAAQGRSKEPGLEDHLRSVAGAQRLAEGATGIRR